MLRLLTNGRPVAIEDIATALQISEDEVAGVLHQFSDAQYDEQGRVTGKGLTLVPTPHRFSINGHTLFTWCALDTLMYPPILQQSAHVESPCVVTGAPVKLTITPVEVKDVIPANAVVSVVIPEQTDVCCNVRSAFCNHVNFFSSPEAAATWLAKHPTAFMLSVAEAYQVGRILGEHLYGEAAPTPG